MHKSPIISYCLIILLALFITVTGLFSYDQVFTELDNVIFKPGDIQFKEIIGITPINNGFILLLQQTVPERGDLIVRIDNTGKITAKYGKNETNTKGIDQKESEAGKIEVIENIIVCNNHVYAAEFIKPVVHQFSLNLEFEKDHQVKKAGKLYNLEPYLAIWSLNLEKDGNYMLALYKKDNFKFKKFSFPIANFPAIVYSWGGVCKAGKKKYAGVYATDYQVYLFDKKFRFKKKLIKNVPNHIKRYYRLKQEKDLSKEVTKLNWLKSWSKMHSIFYLNKRFIIKYVHKNKRFLDIYTAEGTPILTLHEIASNERYYYTDCKQFLWKVRIQKTENNSPRYVIIKEKFNL